MGNYRKSEGSQDNNSKPIIINRKKGNVKRTASKTKGVIRGGCCFKRIK